MKINIFKRLITVYLIIGKTFGNWLSPIFIGLIVFLLRIIVFLFMFLDRIFIPSLWYKKIESPIIIVGNPRSGTTFLQRFLVKNGFGTGTQLWQMIYSSIILQKILKPFLPILEYLSPAKHHSTDAHKTSLASVETDDASMLFRFFDGFFLYGFLLSWSEKDLFDWIDPNKRDNTKRDYMWFKALWKRTIIASKGKRIVAKLFSVSASSPKFIKEFQDSKILYMVRDPLSLIPSGLSLVTGVLDKMFGFWNLPESKRMLFISRLYNALIELLLRFEKDWSNGNIDKSKVMIVHFDKMMNNFDELMDDIIKFTNHESTDILLNEIKITSEQQKTFKSKHKYDLKKFGLSEDKIKEDCKKYYETFLY
ncbi:MAG: hypothetical protein CMG46_01230 [Candidatus Marinimicrobia bacterium]|nr:hypothetical protein [Candidatus Neomarinimicrobiota bacterium]